MKKTPALRSQPAHPPSPDPAWARIIITPPEKNMDSTYTNIEIIAQVATTIAVLITLIGIAI